MRFRDRSDAAQRLAERLLGYRGQRPLVLGIPRGGVPMAAAIAAVRRARPAMPVEIEAQDLAQVDEAHVRHVEHVEVAGVEAGTLGAHRVVVRAERLCGLRVFHDLADLGPDELRRGVVGPAVDADVEERVEHELEPALLPPLLVDGAALLVLLAQEGQQHPHAEIKTFQEEEPGPKDCDQDKP